MDHPLHDRLRRAPQTNASVFFFGTINPAIPTTEPADFASHYNPVYPPEKYYDYVASPDYVRFQNCARGVLTDKENGNVVLEKDDLCTWMRVRTEFPSVQAYKSVRTNPVIVGKPASFFINGTARTQKEGGTPTPFTIVDLLPEGFDVDDASKIVPEKRSTLKNPDGTPYDLSKVTVEIEKDYNGSGRTLIRWNVADPVEGSLYSTSTSTFSPRLRLVRTRTRPWRSRPATARRRPPKTRACATRTTASVAARSTPST